MDRLVLGRGTNNEGGGGGRSCRSLGMKTRPAAVWWWSSPEIPTDRLSWAISYPSNLITRSTGTKSYQITDTSTCARSSAQPNRVPPPLTTPPPPLPSRPHPPPTNPPPMSAARSTANRFMPQLKELRFLFCQSGEQSAGVRFVSLFLPCARIRSLRCTVGWNG